MPDAFQYDVFLRHGSKDKAVLRLLAERLRQDGVKVWFDDCEIEPGDNIPAKIEEWLAHSTFGLRISAFGFAKPGMPANSFGSDWAQLACPAIASERRRKSGTCGRGNLPFRDPLNKERRFDKIEFDLPIWHFKPKPT
jgi:hypothetical protein